MRFSVQYMRRCDLPCVRSAMCAICRDVWDLSCVQLLHRKHGDRVTVAQIVYGALDLELSPDTAMIIAEKLAPVSYMW